MNDTPSYIFDTSLKHRNRARADRSQEPIDFLRQEVAERLQDRLQDVNRPFEAILDVGGDMMRFTARSDGADIAEISDKSLEINAAQYGLIVSNLAMHWVNDLPGLLIQLNRALKPDGFLLASMFGGETLKELRHALLAAEAEITGGANARIIPFADVRAVGALLQRAGFALPVADADTLTVTYEHPLKLMQELRGMGEANVLVDRSRKFLRRDVLARACEIYQEEYATEDGRIPATFQVVYLTGWHPHESQQKPMKRGSAAMRLSDALKKGRPDDT